MFINMASDEVAQGFKYIVLVGTKFAGDISREIPVANPYEDTYGFAGNMSALYIDLCEKYLKSEFMPMSLCSEYSAYMLIMQTLPEELCEQIADLIDRAVHFHNEINGYAEDDGA